MNMADFLAEATKVTNESIKRLRMKSWEKGGEELHAAIGHFDSMVKVISDQKVLVKMTNQKDYPAHKGYDLWAHDTTQPEDKAYLKLLEFAVPNTRHYPIVVKIGGGEPVQVGDQTGLYMLFISLVADERAPLVALLSKHKKAVS
jgi:hypothetical protein